MDWPNDRAQRPIIQKQQLWSRNGQFKNWGLYKPFKFREGKPYFLISSYNYLFWIGLFLLYSIIFNFSYWSLIGGISNILVLGYFLHTDPGIKSSSYPVLNENQLILQKGFCQKCKIFKNSKIKHCEQCKVCIQNIYFHSKLMKCCISSQNIKQFLLINMCLIIYVMGCFWIKYQISQKEH